MQIDLDIQGRFNVANCTFTPRQRPNQDNSFVNEIVEGVFSLGVLDGVGSDKGSENASRITSEQIANSLYKSSEEKGDEIDKYDLYRAAFFAHRTLKHSEINAATTASYMVIRSDLTFTAANCGDSRQYIYRPSTGEIFMLTVDDSPNNLKDVEDNPRPPPPSAGSIEKRMDHFITVRSMDEVKETVRLQERLSNLKLFKGGRIADVDDELLGAMNHTNKVSRIINSSGAPFISITEGKLQPGDIVFQCTDGLSDALTTEDIKDTLSYKYGPYRLCEAFAAAVKSRKSRDIILPAEVSDDVTFNIAKHMSLKTKGLFS